METSVSSSTLLRTSSWTSSTCRKLKIPRRRRRESWRWRSTSRRFCRTTSSTWPWRGPGLRGSMSSAIFLTTSSSPPTRGWLKILTSSTMKLSLCWRSPWCPNCPPPTTRSVWATSVLSRTREYVEIIKVTEKCTLSEHLTQGWRTLPWVFVGSGMVVSVENVPSQSTLPYRPAYWLFLEYRAQVQTPLLRPLVSRCWYSSLLVIVPSSSSTTVMGRSLQSEPGLVGTSSTLFWLRGDNWQQ